MKKRTFLKNKISATKVMLPDADIAKLDALRRERTLIPEIIYCENKSLEQVLSISRRMYEEKQFVLGTRCPRKYYPTLKKKFASITLLPEAGCFRIGKPLENTTKGVVGILSAGTTDIPVCEEAAFVLESFGVTVERMYDVGVAGLHRLFRESERIQRCAVLIVVAGMEGALPSVVAGLFKQPIIAVPTTIGYGTALSGFTALFAMLTSCAPGVTVVNINNGVGAAAAAFKILSLFSQSHTMRST